MQHEYLWNPALMSRDWVVVTQRIETQPRSLSQCDASGRSQFDRPGMSANANVVHIGIRGSRRWVGGVRAYLSRCPDQQIAIAVADAFFTVGPTGVELAAPVSI
jgi:hypothetical protein